MLLKRFQQIQTKQPCPIIWWATLGDTAIVIKDDRFLFFRIVRKSGSAIGAVDGITLELHRMTSSLFKIGYGLRSSNTWSYIRWSILTKHAITKSGTTRYIIPQIKQFEKLFRLFHAIRSLNDYRPGNLVNMRLIYYLRITWFNETVNVYTLIWRTGNLHEYC